MNRKRRSARERERLLLLHGARCYLCGGGIHPGEAWELEHVVPWELTRDEGDDNVKPAHATCHAAKTGDDVRGLRKADRQRQKSYGIKTRKGPPMAGSKASGWRKKMSGEVEKR